MGGIQRGLERKRAREGRRETDKKKEEKWGHFLPEEVLSSETTFLNKNRGLCSVFIIVVFPPVWLRQRRNLWSKSIIIESFMIPQMLL